MNLSYACHAHRHAVNNWFPICSKRIKLPLSPPPYLPLLFPYERRIFDHKNNARHHFGSVYECDKYVKMILTIPTPTPPHPAPEEGNVTWIKSWNNRSDVDVHFLWSGSRCIVTEWTALLSLWLACICWLDQLSSGMSRLGFDTRSDDWLR